MKINFQILGNFIWMILIGHSIALQAQDLTLTAARSAALSNNYGILIQQMESDIANLQNTAGFAGMLPSINATAGYNTELSNSEQKFFSGETRSVDNASANALDAGVYLNWTIFDGFAMFATKSRLDEIAAIGELQLKQAIENTIFNLDAAWYQMIQLQESEKVNIANIAVTSERLNIARNREAFGASSRLEVLKAEVDLTADSAALLQTSLLLKNTKATINSLMGLDPAATFVASDKIVVNTGLVYNDLYEKSMAANTDLQIVKKDEAIVLLKIKEFKSMMYPQINLVGGYGYLKSTSESGFIESNLNYGPSVGVTLTVPLFNGFTTSKSIDIAETEHQIALTQTQNSQLQLSTYIYALYNQYTTSVYMMQMEGRNLLAAKENVEIALQKFNLGNITSIELREIQQSLLDNENRLLSASLNAKLAELQLLKLSGQLSIN